MQDISKTISKLTKHNSLEINLLNEQTFNFSYPLTGYPIAPYVNLSVS